MTIKRLRKLLVTLSQRLKGDFHEEDHPRADDGKFGSGGGGDAAPAPAAKPKPAPSGHANERVVTPLTVAEGDRPYKYPGVTTIENVLHDDKHPIVQLDPKQLLTWQADIAPSRLAKVEGAIRTPIIVVEWQGRYYIEEGNHRAAAAMRDGTKVPAKIIRGVPPPPPQPDDDEDEWR